MNTVPVVELSTKKDWHLSSGPGDGPRHGPASLVASLPWSQYLKIIPKIIFNFLFPKDDLLLPISDCQLNSRNCNCPYLHFCHEGMHQLALGLAWGGTARQWRHEKGGKTFYRYFQRSFWAKSKGAFTFTIHILNIECCQRSTCDLTVLLFMVRLNI